LSLGFELLEATFAHRWVGETFGNIVAAVNYSGLIPTRNYSQEYVPTKSPFKASTKKYLFLLTAVPVLKIRSL